MRQRDPERGPPLSQRFSAFLFVEAGLLVIMGIMLANQEVEDVGGNIAFITTVITAGFLSTGYILGEAALARYVQVAEIATRGAPQPSPPTPSTPSIPSIEASTA